jgi:cobalt/nickel transport system ATP-binding protein
MSHKLSGGEKRLVALAGNLAMNPELMLMDEPSSYLDPRSRKLLIAILQGLDQAILMATHDLDMALDVCSRVIVLKQGQIVADGQADAILSDGALLFDCGLELPLTLESRRR